MAKRKILAVLTVVVLFTGDSACSGPDSGKQDTVFKQVPEIAEIKPETPVKIKLKRNGDGGYSWELSGDDAEKVLQADRKLKQALWKESSK